MRKTQRCVIYERLLNLIDGGEYPELGICILVARRKVFVHKYIRNNILCLDEFMYDLKELEKYRKPMSQYWFKNDEERKRALMEAIYQTAPSSFFERIYFSYLLITNYGKRTS